MNKKPSRLSALTRQVQHLDHRLAALDKISSRYSTIRLVIILVGVPLIAVTFFSRSPEIFWLCLVIATAAFSTAVAIHRRFKHSIAEYTIWREIKQTHIARMSLDWAHIPPATIHPKDYRPVETDLDLPMLHRLINTTASREGSQRLRDWLLTPKPDAGAIRHRQAIVRELIRLPIFRDKLTLYADLAAQDSRLQPDNQALLHWLSQGQIGPLRPVLFALAALASVNIALFLLFDAELIPPLWVITWLVYVVLSISQWKPTRELFQDALTLSASLRELVAVMGYLEDYRYGKNTHLRALCAPIWQERPSRQLRQVTWVASAASLRQNPILWPIINAVIPWDIYFAYRFHQHKTQLVQQLPGWLDVRFELETLCSLANFAYLNPDYTFPRIVPDSVFKVWDIGHPLIPDSVRVCNDFAFSHLGELVIITGSNMAGKSSFLRTLGVNLCLAYAGSVVNAQSLETDLFRLFSCIRVTDSLDNGISYFYAEVKRLKALLDALYETDDLPLFFLIDEIFRGTNNRERLIGSRAYVQALTNQNGVGLIATHDLELVKLADDQPAIQNYHFRETIADGRMVFDYRLRPGPCPTTNALKIMAMAGLPVEPGK